MVLDFVIKGRFSWGVNQIFIMLLFKGPMIRCLGVFCFATIENLGITHGFINMAKMFL